MEKRPMILYGTTLSPFVRKTMAYVTEKGLSVEHIGLPPRSSEPAFCETSPFGKIPGFRDGDFAISDSTAIITYLETKHPEPALLPASPASRARAVWYDEFADTVMFPVLAKLFFNRVVAKLRGIEPDLAAADKAEKEELPPLLNYLESVIPASGYLVDDRLTLADLSVASPFVNFAHSGASLDTAMHPKTAAYVEAILARPSFAPLIAQEKAFLAG